MQEILAKLSKSKFRNKFKLSDENKFYVKQKGIDTIQRHAIDFVKNRIAPANILNDGKQTPTKNHPVFIAQHATACCCRKCINKWHGFAQNTQLSTEQQNYLVSIIMQWIKNQME